MNPFEKIELKKDTFTKKEMIVYNILQKNPDLILRGSITSLAKDYQVSQSTIHVFVKKLVMMVLMNLNLMFLDQKNKVDKNKTIIFLLLILIVVY